MEKVAHSINSITDLITGDETGQYTGPIPVMNQTINNPGDWWLEKDRNGEIWLCRYATVGVMAFIDCTDNNGNNPYTAKASSFIGGRPKDR